MTRKWLDREPTQEMIRALDHPSFRGMPTITIWRAMFDAAPAAQPAVIHTVERVESTPTPVERVTLPPADDLCARLLDHNREDWPPEAIDQLYEEAAARIEQLKDERDKAIEVAMIRHCDAKDNGKTILDFHEVWLRQANDRARRAEAECDRLRAELANIANAKRFDRKTFDDDTAFADWAQSRARAAIDAARKENAGTKPAS